MTQAMTDHTVTVTGAGHAVITALPGAGTAEIRLTITMPGDADAAGLHLRTLIGPPPNRRPPR
jgi:hypothetical protein